MFLEKVNTVEILWIEEIYQVVHVINVNTLCEENLGYIIEWKRK